MTNWRPDFDAAHLHFVTARAVKQFHLFQSDVAKRLIVDSLDCMRLRSRFKLFSFVIMPNHLHVIVQCSAEDPVAACVRDLKRHTTDRLVRQFHIAGNQEDLDLLSSASRHLDQGQEIWSDDHQVQDIFSPAFLREKMTYIHNNPCQPRWHLAERPEDYAWSSARFYLLGKPAIIPINTASPLLT